MLPNITASDIAGLTIWIPLVLALISIVSAVSKYIRNRLISQGAIKHEMTWEIHVALLGLLGSLIGAYLERHTTEMRSLLKEYVKEEQVRVLDGVSKVTAIDEFDSQINRVIDLRHDDLVISRTVFSPGMLKVDDRAEDRPAYNAFAAGKVSSIRYLVGVGSQRNDMSTASNSDQRMQMLVWLFQFLTNDRWNVIANRKRGLEVHVLPYSKTFESWCVVSPSGDRAGGLTLLAGQWSGTMICPHPKSLLTLNHVPSLELMSSEFEELRSDAIQNTQMQLAQDEFHREPYMIFYSGDPARGLSPVSLEAISRKTDSLCRTWAGSHGAASLTGSLTELKRVLDEVRRQSAD